MTVKVRKTPVVRSDVSPDWAAWGRKLSKTLKQIKEDEFLVISTKQGNQFVQFAGEGSFGMRIETISNEYRGAEHQLTNEQATALIALGWHPPTCTAKEEAEHHEPHGSPNFYFDAKHPVRCNSIAQLAVSTLAEVLGVLHPGELQYCAYDTSDKVIEFPSLGLKQASDNVPRESTATILLNLLRDITGLPHLDYDEDGDLSIGVDNVAIYVSLIESDTHIRFRTDILKGVKKQSGLYESLNDLNATVALVRYAYAGGTIFSILDVPASPLSRDRVERYFLLCAKLGNAMSTSFKAQFVSKATAPSPKASGAIH